MLNLTQNTRLSRGKALSLTITLVALFFAGLGAKGGDFSAGPFFDQFPLTLDSGQRTEIMGPFYYQQQTAADKIIAFPPFFSSDTDPAIDASEYDSLYPIFSYVRYGTQYRAQLIELFSFSGGQDPDNLERRRFTIYPLYFQQRSPDTNDNYTAVVPFYGHLKGRLFRDQIFFVMFPAYSETRKRDVVNDNYLYPFFNARHGDGMHGWQFWPFYGTEHKVVTTTTNDWGEVITNGGHNQMFALWPIHFRQDNGIGTGNTEKFRADLPFYSWFRSPQRDQTSVLWPFFNWINNREPDKQYREWEMPWPFIVVSRGEGKTGLRIFPFYGHATNSIFRDDFYLWPIYKFNSVYSPPLDRRRTRILLFLFQDTVDRNTETGKAHQRLDLWPLFVHTSDFNGNTRLQVFAPVESFVPSSPGIERNWAPLWSVWRQENNPATGADSQSFLWNFYRRDAAPGSKRISFFFGLYQSESTRDTKKVRLFYIPVIDRHPYQLSQRGPW
jgi:hypothetical protein